MSVASCVEHYNDVVGCGEWDVLAVSEAVQEAKEAHYQELTADGISAFPGARALILEALSLGIAVGVGSSGMI